MLTVLTHALTFALGLAVCAAARALSDRMRRERLRRSTESLMPPYLPEAEYRP